MVSLSFINGSDMKIPTFDPYDIFESEMDVIMDSLATAKEEYDEAVNEYNTNIEFLESANESMLEAAGEKHANFVDKLGNSIIELGKKAVAFINKLISKIQESLFANKSDMEKISALCKQNPEMADEINKAFREGNLQVADMKSLKEIESAYDEIMRLAKQEKVDPDSLKGKWANAKKKFGNLDQSDIIKGVGITLGIAASATTLIVNIGKLPDAIYAIKHWSEIARDKTKAAELTMEKLEAETKAAKAKADKENTEASFLKNSYNDRMSKAANDAKKSKLDAEYTAQTQSERIRTTKANAAKAAEEVRQARTKTKDKALDTLVKGSFESSMDLAFDENGYITESAADSVRSIVASVHRDMMKIYTTLAQHDYSILERAKSIINAAIKGYNKPIKQK